MSQYFPKPYEPFGGDINVKVDLSNYATKTDFKLKGISDRVTKNKTKHLLVENELIKLKTLGLSYFCGKKYFEGNDGTQNSLVFQVGEKYFKDNSGSDTSSIEIWKSKGLSN